MKQFQYIQVGGLLLASLASALPVSQTTDASLTDTATSAVATGEGSMVPAETDAPVPTGTDTLEPTGTDVSAVTETATWTDTTATWTDVTATWTDATATWTDTATSTYSAESDMPTPTVIDSNVQGPVLPYMYGCNAEQQDFVTQAWYDAAVLAAAHAEWAPGNDSIWQPAMDLYIGKESADDEAVFANILRQYGIHFNTNYSPTKSHAYLYCYHDTWADQQCGDGTYAYTWDDNAPERNLKYTMLCPTFFAQNETLATLTEQASTNPKLQQIIDAQEWYDSAVTTVFHETYHWSPEVSVPKCDLDPEVYDAQTIVEMAQNQYNNSIINAESYTKVALAIYIQKTFDVPLPIPAFMATNEQKAKFGLEEKTTKRSDHVHTHGVAPRGWVAPRFPDFHVGGGMPAEEGWVQMK